MRNAGLTVRCESCGHDFHVKPSWLKAAAAKGQRRRFCSMRCRTAARTSRIYPSELRRKLR